jgi:hypothetical protein
MVQFIIHRDAQALGTNLIKEFSQPEDRPFVFSEIDTSTVTLIWELEIPMPTLASQ